MADKQKSGNPSKPRKKKDEKISTFQKVFLIFEVVMLIIMIAFGIYVICDSRKDLRRTDERKELKIKIKKSEIPEIKKQYKEMCKFYLDTAGVTDVTFDETQSAEEREKEQKEYLLKTFAKYLGLEELAPNKIRKWHEKYKFLSDFIFDKVKEKKAIKIKAELIRRWKLIIEIQEILKEKLKEVQLESEDYLSSFVDGRLGHKTQNLASAILTSTYSGHQWYLRCDFSLLSLQSIFQLDESALSSLFKFLKQGKLLISSIKLPKNTIGYINAVQRKIREYKVTQEDHNYKRGEIIRQKIKQAMNFINEQKKEILKSAKSEKEKIEKGRALMMVAVNYLVKSWEGSPAGTKNGWARYPYDEKGRLDSRYTKVDCSTYVKRIIETLFPEINKRYPWIAQVKPSKELALYAAFLGISREEKEEVDEFDTDKILVIDCAASHMKLMFADLEDDCDFAVIKISEASGGVKNRLLIIGNKAGKILEGTVNVSSDTAVKKWLSNN